MRVSAIVAIVALACGTAVNAREAVRISYTEDYSPGRAVPLTQGIWDCGTVAEQKAVGAMTLMARRPAGQQAVATALGCRRTLDPTAFERPWHVLRHVAALCEERSMVTDDVHLPDGRTKTQAYDVCGREAHTLVIGRDGERRTAIAVLDLAAYD